MGDSAKESKKVGFFTRVSAEFKKIIWPSKMTVVRQSTAVVLVSIVLGALIKVVDLVVQFGLNLLIN